MPDNLITDDATPGFVEKVLAHYGVKGMRWGYSRRQQGRADVQRALGAKKSAAKREAHVKRLEKGEATVRDHARSGGLFVKPGQKKTKEVSEDAAKAAGAQAKAKTKGKQSLSNEEMQALVTRMNLEKQLSNLTPASRTQQGAKFAGGLLANVGKQQAQMIVNDQVNKQLKKALSSR